MSDTRELLRRGVEGFEPMPDAFERVLIRRDRKRRNQRIAAGVVGIAIFVSAVWVVMTGGSLDRSETPPAPGGPGPSVGSSDTPEVDYLLDLNTGAESPLPKAITRLHDAGGEVGSLRLRATARDSHSSRPAKTAALRSSSPISTAPGSVS